MSKINLNSNEKILLIRRRHWYFLVYGIFVFVFLSLIPLLLYSISFFFEINLDQAVSKYFWGFSFLYLFALMSLAYKAWIDFYLDVWIVTNERVFDIEQKGLFSREVSIFNLSNVQDVSVEMHGPVATFLDFGEVHVQTAGETREFVFHQVAKPYEVQKIIIDLNHKLL